MAEATNITNPIVVEHVARAMASRRGNDPDELVQATGYPDAEWIPRWKREIEWAERFLLARAALADGEA